MAGMDIALTRARTEIAPALRFNLPVPISLNNAYANRKGGRYPTKEHTAWKAAAGWELKSARPGKVEGPYRLTLLLPHDIRGDVSNRVKLLEDLLVEHGITPDDKYAQGISAQRSIDVMPGRCVVILEAA